MLDNLSFCNSLATKANLIPSRNIHVLLFIKDWYVDICRHKYLHHATVEMVFFLIHDFGPHLVLKQTGKGKGKVHPCTGTEALYRPYSP